MRSFISAAVFGVALTLAATAQEKTDKKETAPQAPTNAVEVRFADDSTVKMVLLDSNIAIATRYGKLTIPTTDIRRIEFGLHIAADTAKRIDAAIAQLASKDYKQREAATAELLGLREQAFPALQQAAKSTDLEVSRRAKEALKTLADTLPPEKLHLPRHDTIVTVDFTVLGQIEAETFKAKTPYFGEASLKLAEVRNMRWVGSEREAKLALDAEKYASPQETWLDTNIAVHSGMGLQIAATGTIDLQPMNPGNNMAGPDGLNTRMGGRADGRGGFPGGGGGGFPGRPRNPNSTTQYPGMLLGRVGEFGKVFIVGSRYDGQATEDGKLQLRIVPSTTGEAATGKYDIRVTTGR